MTAQSFKLYAIQFPSNDRQLKYSLVDNCLTTQVNVDLKIHTPVKENKL